MYYLAITSSSEPYFLGDEMKSSHVDTIRPCDKVVTTPLHDLTLVPAGSQPHPIPTYTLLYLYLRTLFRITTVRCVLFRNWPKTPVATPVPVITKQAVLSVALLIVSCLTIAHTMYVVSST